MPRLSCRWLFRRASTRTGIGPWISHCESVVPLAVFLDNDAAAPRRVAIHFVDLSIKTTHRLLSPPDRRSSCKRISYATPSRDSTGVPRSRQPTRRGRRREKWPRVVYEFSLARSQPHPEKWWARQGSNLRPIGYEPTALPLSYGPRMELAPRFKAGWGILE